MGIHKLQRHLARAWSRKASSTMGPTSRESCRVPLKLAATVPSTHSGAVNYRPRAALQSAIVEKVFCSEPRVTVVLPYWFEYFSLG